MTFRFGFRALFRASERSGFLLLVSAGQASLMIVDERREKERGCVGGVLIEREHCDTLCVNVDIFVGMHDEFCSQFT